MTNTTKYKSSPGNGLVNNKIHIYISPAKALVVAGHNSL